MQKNIILKLVIDLATLTGSAVAAIGHYGFVSQCIKMQMMNMRI